MNRRPIEQAAFVLVTDSLLGGLDDVQEDSAVFLPSQFTGREHPRLLTATTLWRLAFASLFVLGGIALGRRTGQAFVATLLGILALVVWTARFLGGMPEMSQNVAWLLYCPLDFCLHWQKPWVRVYTLARLFGVVCLVVASLAGFINQSVYWPVLAIVAGLCTVAYSTHQKASRAARTTAALPRKQACS